MIISDQNLDVLKKIYEIASKSNEINAPDYNGWVSIDLKEVASKFKQLNENNIHYLLVYIEDYNKWYSFNHSYTNVNPEALEQKILQYSEAKTSQKNASTLVKNSKNSIKIAIAATLISLVSLGISFYKSSNPISLSISEYNEEISKITESEKELKLDISTLDAKTDDQGREISQLIEQLKDLENKILELNAIEDISPPEAP